MPTADKVVVELEAKTGKYTSDVRRAAGDFDRNVGRMARSAEASERRIRAASDGIGASLRAAAGTIAAGVGVAAAVRLADSYTRVVNQLKIAGLEGERLASVQERLLGIANANGTEVEGLAILYSGLANLQRDLNTTSEESIALTQSVANAIKIGGRSASSAAGAILGLNQALAQTRVQTDEFNQIADGARPLLLAAAQASDKYGGSLARLKADIEAGNVSGAEFFRILRAGSPVLQELAGKATLTIGQAFTTLNNQLGQYIGQSDDSLSVTERLAAGIELLGDNLDTVIPALTVLVSVIGGRYLLALTASAGATALATANSLRYQFTLLTLAARQNGVTVATAASTAATQAFSAALAANPIGLAIIAVAALGAGVFYLNQQYGDAAVVARQVGDVTDGLTDATDAYAEAALAAATATGEARTEALAEVAALRTLQAEARAAAVEKLNLAKASLAQAQAQLAANAAARSDPTNADARTQGGLGQVGGDLRNRVATTTQIIEQSAALIAKADTAIARIDRGLSGGGGGGGGGGGNRAGGSGGAASGPSPTDLAAQRQQLAYEFEIARLRALGDEQAARGLERLRERQELEKRLSDAGVENAADVAAARTDELSLIEDTRAAAEESFARTAAAVDLAVADQERINEGLRRELELQLELARLAGDEQGATALQRRLDALDRRQRYGVGNEAAADRDSAMVTSAEDAARERDLYRGYAAEFVDVLRSGNIWESLGQRFADAAANNLESILADILQAIFSANSNGGGGNGVGNTLANVASAIFSGRANGGPVQSGRAYLVGDRTRLSDAEVFRPGVAGSVTPLRGLNGGPKNITIKQGDIYITGQGDAALRAYVQQSMLVTRQQTLADVRNSAPSEQLENRLLRE